MTRSIARSIYLGGAWLLVVGAVVQVFLAGLGVFDDPSVFITQICGVPVRFEVHAIWLPVGDHVGEVSMSGWFVIRRRPLPSRFMT